jgi:hypothetical protein
MIGFTPVATPALTRADEIYAFFQRHKDTAAHVPWNYYALRLNREGKMPGRAKYMLGLDWQWTERFAIEFPEFIALLESLPFQHVTFVNLLENKRAVATPQDLVEEEWNASSVHDFRTAHAGLEPCIYRILIKGNRANCGFYLSARENETRPEAKRFIRLPPDANAFAFNGTELFHGAEKVEDEKLLCFISGYVDRERHLKRIDESVARYADYVLRFDDV